MKRDFTLSVYQKFLNTLIEKGYTFQRFRDYISKPGERSVVLRHDVDARPANSLEFARIQHQLGIQGTYYFRTVPQSFDPSIIREIAAMGHEIGYHYETMDTADGDPVLALKHFEDGLKPLRDITEIRTICMHSSPLSRYDNRDLWKSYSYRDYGIIGEPYFDLDFSRVLYLTDTGRRWDGDKVSVRDRAPQSVLASAGGLRQVPDGQSRHLGDANAGKPGQALDGQSRHPGDVNTEETGQASEGWIRRPGNVNNKGSGQGSEQQVSRPGKAKADVSGEASEEQDRRPDKAN